jgi:phosphoheptose isomerase
MDMKTQTENIFNSLISEYSALECVKCDIKAAYNLLKECYLSKKKTLICGNGGSASDSEHIAGELMKGFMLKRPLDIKTKNLLTERYPQSNAITDKLQGTLRAISLASQTSIMTAVSNDIGGDMLFAQQVYGYLDDGDILIALSTSGNAPNVINAAVTARALNGKVISFIGADGGKLKEISNVAVCLPSVETYKIQEYTLPVYHALCAMIENEFFG